MIGIALKFPSGRFHATPWGRHVNEGVPEWPPSPWRLLRSIVATWKTKAEELPEDQVRTVLGQLLEPPTFALPEATTGHSRHYMRWYKKGPEDQTLVFDAFVCLDRASEVVAIWPQAQLNGESRHTLATLLQRLGYLGRAESWCQAELISDEVAERRLADANCRPLNGASPGGKKEEIVRVLVADPKDAFGNEHVQSKKTGKRKRPAYDPAWHLCIETSQLHAEKWSDPPGSRWVNYVRQADCFDPPPKLKPRPRRVDRRAQVVRFALDSTVLPLVTETLPIAEHVRRKLMGIHGRLTERNGVKGRSDVLSGKDAEGRPLTGHRHAYFLPTDEDGDGRLDHLTIVAEDGFNRDELKALDRLRSLNRGEKVPELRLLMLGWGATKDFSVLPVQEAERWVSTTPFLVTRHPKKRGRKRDPNQLLQDPHAFVTQVLREEVERLFERREISMPSTEVQIKPLYDPAGVFRIRPSRWAKQAAGPNLRCIQFKRFRSRKLSDDGGRRPAGAFHITFPSEVRGPICLGHSSHFGLGLFLPAT